MIDKKQIENIRKELEKAESDLSNNNSLNSDEIVNDIQNVYPSLDQLEKLVDDHDALKDTVLAPVRKAVVAEIKAIDGHFKSSKRRSFVLSLLSIIIAYGLFILTGNNRAAEFGDVKQDLLALKADLEIAVDSLKAKVEQFGILNLEKKSGWTTPVIDQNGDPEWSGLNGKFDSQGGGFMLFLSGSGFSREINNKDRKIGMEVWLDDKKIREVTTFTNEKYSHKEFGSEVWTCASIPEGNHTIRLRPVKGTRIDHNDHFEVLATELNLPMTMLD